MRMLKGTRALTGAGLVLVLFFGLKPAQAEPDRIEVVLDQAKVLKMPKDAQTVIIGNPIVADITVLKNRSMILTAKGYGVTNMIALDAQGRQRKSADFAAWYGSGVVFLRARMYALCLTG